MLVHENPLDVLQKREAIIKDRVRGVVHGQSNGMYLHGRPGTSKTYLVRTLLDTLRVSNTYSNGHLTPVGLFDLVAENPSSIIVLDDVSTLFNQPIGLQILLAALGSPHNGTRNRVVRYKKAQEDLRVHFSGGVIAISNLPPSGHHAEVMGALRDRVQVLNYDPTDEQMIAQIINLAEQDPRGVPSSEAYRVADFLIEECKRRNVRPSIRLFLDKALADYQLYADGKTETDWRDLVISSIDCQVLEPERPLRNLSKKEEREAEKREVRAIYLGHPNRAERVKAWQEKTGKSQKTMYRRIAELKAEGRLQ